MEKRKRPAITEGPTYRKETACGHLYITIGKDNGSILEIFAHLGKAGSCAMSQNEGLTRAISLGLKYGVPVEEYIEQLKGIRCTQPIWESGVQILSCADAIAQVLELETSGKEKEQK